MKITNSMVMPIIEEIANLQSALIVLKDILEKLQGQCEHNWIPTVEQKTEVCANCYKRQRTV